MEHVEFILHVVRGTRLPRVEVIEVNGPMPSVGHVYELGELSDAPLLHDVVVTDVLRTSATVRVRCVPSSERTGT